MKENKKMNKVKSRILLGSVVCLAGTFVALAGAGLYSAPSKARREAVPGSAVPAANAPEAPDVVHLVGPVVSNTKLQDLPYVAPNAGIEESRLTRYQFPEVAEPAKPVAASGITQFQSLFEKSFVRCPACHRRYWHLTESITLRPGALFVIRPIRMATSARIITCNR